MADEPKQKILIVDDEIVVVEYFKSAIKRRWPVEVLTTANGPEAIELVRDHNPVLIFMDIRIEGGMDGWEVIQKIREFNDQVKIVVVTGNMFVAADESTAIKHHALHSILTKPVILKDFLPLIKEILDEKGVYQQFVVKPRADVSVKGSPAARAIIHSLNNRLNSIRLKCDRYVSDIRDGLTDGKTDKELIDESLFVCQFIISEIDSAKGILEDIRKLQ